MRLLLTIVVAALSAFAARAALAGSNEAAPESAPSAGLGAEVAALRAENERLARELEQRAAELRAPVAPVSEIGEAEIAAALERWRAAHPEGLEAVAEARARAARAGQFDFAGLPMDQIVHALETNRFDDFQQQTIFQQLRDSGRIDEYVAALEAQAKADPENADLQVALGHAYLQKLFGLGNSPEVGTFAMKSDAAFDLALELDDTNWNARFSKAVSLSNWPAFLGRGPEAIEHFEILIEQQEGQPLRPEFEMPYLFLGNMHQAAGKRELAIAAWKAGLALFPGSDELRRVLELAEGR